MDITRPSFLYRANAAHMYAYVPGMNTMSSSHMTISSWIASTSEMPVMIAALIPRFVVRSTMCVSAQSIA